MQRFLVVMERAGGNYSAYAPDLPRCVATGVTLEETRRNMHEAIEMHIEGLRQDHLPVPEPSLVAEFVEVAS
jgi:predicted RNase H-like HicB family nuclease